MIWEPDDKRRTVFRIRPAGVEVCFHRWVGVPNKWFVTCRDLGLERRELKHEDEAAAMAEAEALVVRCIRATVRKLEAAADLLNAPESK